MTLTRITNSLVTRLIIFGVLLVVFGAVSRYVVLSKVLHDNLVQVFSTQQETLAEAIATDVDYKLTQRRDVLARMAQTLPQPLLSQPAALREWLALRQDLLPLFSLGVTVVDPQGRILADYPPSPQHRDTTFTDDADFQVARLGQATIGRPRLDTVSKHPALQMAVPVLSTDGRVNAVLLGDTALDAPGFLDRVRYGQIGRTGGFELVSPRDKLFITASNARQVFTPTPPIGVNLLLDRAMAGFRGSGVTVNSRGVEELEAMAPVASTGWFVVARLPTTEVLATVSKVQRYVVLSTWVGVGVVSLVVGLLVTWMLRPLYRAADQATRMTHGEIPLRQLPVVWQDEVGHLTLAYNRLLAKLTSSQAELERMAHRDALTGLLNRSLLAELVQQALARAQRDKTRVALLFLDLDGFKPLNDTFGHEAGDAALREVARRLESLVGEAEILARVGGDEFVLLAPDLKEPVYHNARVLADRCLSAVSEPLLLPHGTYTLGVSIGIAMCAGGCSVDRLLAAADKAMYQAKQDGRGGFAIAPLCDNCAQSGANERAIGSGAPTADLLD